MARHFPHSPYVGGTDADDIDRAFERIVDALITDDVHFLFGAGMSKESEVPIESELGATLLTSFFPTSGNPPTTERMETLIREFPFEATVEAVQNSLGNGRDDLTKALKKILIDPDFEVSQAHKDFLSICYWQGHAIPSQIFTTNFDTLLEKSIGPAKVVTIYEDNAKGIKKEQEKGKLPVIHLHGVLNNKYQVTETDVFETSFSTLDNIFENALFNAEAFVFVGYSMADPDFRRIYMEYRKQWKLRKGDSDKKTYFVSPPKDEFSYRLGKKIWENRGAVWLPFGAGEFFARLKHLMGTRAEAAACKKIMDKYGLTDETAFEDLITTTVRHIGGTRQDAIVFLVETRTSMGVTR